MFDNNLGLYLVVSVCIFKEKNVNSKNEFTLIFKQKFKKFTNKKFFQLIFFFQLILIDGAIGNATLNLKEGIVISKM